MLKSGCSVKSISKVLNDTTLSSGHNDAMLIFPIIKVIVDLLAATGSLKSSNEMVA